MMDSHLHTECSFDCVPGCSDGLGEWAMALGLSGFTVTDHLEIGVDSPYASARTCWIRWTMSGDCRSASP